MTKVCGIETEYGIQVVSAGDMSPTTASSLLINAYVAQLERKVGWDFEDESPGTRRPGLSPARGPCPPRSRRTSSTPCSPTGRATTSTTPIRSTRPRSARTPLELVLHDRAGELVLRRSMEAADRLLPHGRADRHLQEQLRRQGQLLRLPRELPRRPGRALLADRARADPSPRDAPDLHRGRQDRRGGLPRGPRADVPAQPARPTSSRRRSASRRRSSARSSTPGTSLTPTPSSTAGST